ncbi:DNA-binding response regulator [Brachybacterium endophyticum]|uniref:DNA-binding response regulator n=1 Tax=Brachybacterium endophyticum TaxID=2182385 RepID=A0A2U2RHM8_9MICO|nr:response regulator transcription factor [Brachybacterium endophyticum]PWH05373.1 DNA-binding response regulator [Brachybacterium endophyticum]
MSKSAQSELPSRPTRVVVVEDEPTITGAIADRLTAEGWDVSTALDGPSGVRTVSEVRPDVVVLDVMLPGFDGLEVCRRIQAEEPVPVLMLTARDDETDMLVGLGVGADDYMTKPFSMRELVARLKALLRRVRRAAAVPDPAAGGPGEQPAMLQLGDLVIDRAAHRVTRAGAPAHLTPTEFDLLLCLATAPGTVLTREQLLADVWDWVDATGTRTVDSHVKALRRKLGADLVRTVHGVGYALELPDEDEEEGEIGAEVATQTSSTSPVAPAPTSDDDPRSRATPSLPDDEPGRSS